MKKNYSLLLVLLFAFGFASLNAEVLYVKADGSGDGSSWANAASLDDALTWASDGDEIYVAKGTYTGSFKSRKLIKVYGNCDGTETAPPAITSAEGLETFLKGPGGKRVLYIDTKASEWIGFDISGGDASEEATGVGRGGGVYVNDNGGTLKYCRIHNNIGMDGALGLLNANGNPLKGVGGGAYIWNGRLENCIIENNIATDNPFRPETKDVWASGVGGGICLDATVSGNQSEPEKAVVLNCIIRNNSTTPSDDENSYPSQGGGIAIKSGKLINSLIVGNNIYGSKNNQNVGGGVACTERAAHVINCTAVKNNVPGLGGGIAFQTTNAGGVTAAVSNCIAWGNTSRDDDYGIGNENIRFGSSTDGALEDKVTISAVICPQATVSPSAITDNPKFTDYAGGDYTLQEGSPAIDAGDDPPIAGYDKDLAGNARIVGDAVDIGAYEYSGQVGINEIDEADEIIATEYYTLQGVKIEQPTVSGIYLVKLQYVSQKTATKKLFITK